MTDEAPKSMFGFRGMLLGPTTTRTVEEIEEELRQMRLEEFRIALPDDPKALVRGDIITALYDRFVEKIEAASTLDKERVDLRSAAVGMLNAVHTTDLLLFSSERNTEPLLREAQVAVANAFALGFLIAQPPASMVDRMEMRVLELLAKEKVETASSLATRGGRRSGENRNAKIKKGWKATLRKEAARRTAARSAISAPLYSAQKLAEEIHSSWPGLGPELRGVGVFADEIRAFAAEPDCPFKLHLDGRAKKVRQ